LEDYSSQADSMDNNELEMALKEWGDEEENSRPPSPEELAAVPEASPEQLEAGRSKRRAGWLMRKWEWWLSARKR
jgi:hypothetical protein